jgi:hypothetical protein
MRGCDHVAACAIAIAQLLADEWRKKMLHGGFWSLIVQRMRDLGFFPNSREPFETALSCWMLGNCDSTAAHLP